VGRELLCTLLGYAGHHVLQAHDGQQALEQVRAEVPDLVIADVLMPGMDGYELVRQLRAQPSGAAIPVIFYTAAYHEREARALAEQLGVAQVLTKPGEPDVLLRSVELALRDQLAEPERRLSSDFDQQHLRVVNDRLVRSTHELEVLNARLAVLVELGLRLASEADPQQLLQTACDAAREVVGAEAAVIQVHEAGQPGIEQRMTSGGAPDTAVDPKRRLLIVPLATSAQTYGELRLSRGRHAEAFSASDERLAAMLAAQLALAYENAKRARDLSVAIRARDEFISIAAHELRTPVTSMLGYAQLLSRPGAKRPFDPDRQARALKTVEQQAKKLSRLIGQLLDVSRCQAGKLSLDCQVADITALVRGAVATARLRGRDHKFAEPAARRVLALVDPLRLEQVINNLLENALKYSPNGSQIDVSVKSVAPDRVRVSVRDSGAGIPSEKRSRIFDRFYQAHSDSHASGMGLGLYISRQIIELHGGRIWAEFPPEGGSQFVFDVPSMKSVASARSGHPARDPEPVASLSAGAVAASAAS